MARKVGNRQPLLCLMAVLVLWGALAATAAAATKTIKPARVKSGSVEFKLTKIPAADIKQAYLTVGKKSFKLKLSNVRKAADRGVLKLKLPKAARKSSGKKKRPVVRLRLVLLKVAVKPPPGGSGGGSSGGGGGNGGGPPPDPFPHSGFPVVSAAGDIACDPAFATVFNGGNGTAEDCRHKYTAQLLTGSDAVLALGDESYGYENAFETSYDPAWGPFKSITHPLAGDHEYDDAAFANITRYANYFGALAGEAGKFYYSFDLPSVSGWHFVALNSNCSLVPCGAGSAQLTWLQSDLAANTAQCTVVYWHHPHYTDGPHVPDEDGSTQAFWEAAANDGADIVLHGNDHNYQRWPKRGALGTPSASGIREFVVGTGGKSHTTPAGTGAEVRNGTTFGVLKLRLRPAGYDWKFLPEAGQSFTDAGSDSCS